MKILILDIETAPNLAYVWKFWKENIGTDQVVNSGYVLCWSAKWLGSDNMIFSSVRRDKPVVMLDKIHRLLDQTDAVIHYNGKSFDIPTLSKEFVLHNMKPPAPYKQIDLMEVVRSEFRFPSAKLDYVCQTLKLGTKVRHPGFELWVRCMHNEPEAWRLMEQYNKQDVLLVEKLYERLKPWVKLHPNHGTFCDGTMCPNCGSTNLQQRGTAVTMVMKYKRYQCLDCGAWSRGNKSITANRDRRLPVL